MNDRVNLPFNDLQKIRLKFEHHGKTLRGALGIYKTCLIADINQQRAADGLPPLDKEAIEDFASKNGILSRRYSRLSVDDRHGIDKRKLMTALVETEDLLVSICASYPDVLMEKSTSHTAHNITENLLYDYMELAGKPPEYFLKTVSGALKEYHPAEDATARIEIFKQGFEASMERYEARKGKHSSAATLSVVEILEKARTPAMLSM